MNREKNVQIPEALFLQLARYFLLDADDQETAEAIKKGLNDKLEAMIKHDLYTRYKTAPTDAERENARQEYLNKAGIPKDFQW